MQRLVKNQYEAIASIFMVAVSTLMPPNDKYEELYISTTKHTVQMLAEGLALLFRESDPEFKREQFIKECGL